mmetsp:Transcript_15477/g.31470  ORF Transcript_15477/g.31470 Transcript_15477/m.31470 type:complete len:201 (-) Transcript_15477:1271-1873(-)
MIVTIRGDNMIRVKKLKEDLTSMIIVQSAANFTLLRQISERANQTNQLTSVPKLIVHLTVATMIEAEGVAAKEVAGAIIMVIGRRVISRVAARPEVPVITRTALHLCRMSKAHPVQYQAGVHTERDIRVVVAVDDIGPLAERGDITEIQFLQHEATLNHRVLTTRQWHPTDERRRGRPRPLVVMVRAAPMQDIPIEALRM